MVETGLGRLLGGPQRWLRGRKFGLVTNDQARGPHGVPGWRLLRSICGPALAAVFTPEHGISARQADAAEIPSTSMDGLKLHSLYGPGGRTAPEPWMLEGLDLLLFDLQDVGARFYTYVSTLVECVRAAAAAGGPPILVLDRPNPLGGLLVEGPGVRPGYEAFVAGLDIPVCHGLTLGEAALLVRRRLGLEQGVVQVLPAAGWRRDMTWEETGLVWYPPSPAATSPGMVRIYPGTCLIEGTGASEGRGTDMPFELVGAPWIDGGELARELATMRPPGARAWPAAAPAEFVPREGKQAGLVCGGVRIVAPPGWASGARVGGDAAFPGEDGAPPGPLAFGVALLQAVLKQGGESIAWRLDGSGRYWLDLLMGGPEVRLGLLAGTSWQEIAAGWRERQRAHRAEMAGVLLYSGGDRGGAQNGAPGHSWVATARYVPVTSPQPASAAAAARSTAELDLLSPEELASVLVASAAEAVEAVRPATAAIATAIRLSADRLSRGGRLIYAGAGTSGRLGALDASECEPTFGVGPGRVLALIAGGKEAFARSREGAEDDAAAAELDVEQAGVGPADVLVGVSASGTTPYTVSAVRAARERGALTVAVVAGPMTSLAAAADVAIETPTGAEPLEGSTRLKAGTAQKVVLNAISTGVFALLGYVYGNRMVGVQPVNAKLLKRAVGLVAALAGVSAQRASAALEECRDAGPRLAVRVAVLSLLARLTPEASRDVLAANGFSLRRALDAAVPERHA